MNAYDFDKLRRCEDEETVAHLVLDEAQDVNAEAFVNAKTPEQKEAAKPINLLTEGQLTVWAVETFFGEICNGGFDQYFFNQGVDITPYAEASLRRVGLDGYAEIMARATAAWPGGVVPTDDAEYDRAFEEVTDRDNDPWDECDSAIYEAMDAEKEATGGYAFRDALYTYIMANPNQFVSDD